MHLENDSDRLARREAALDTAATRGRGALSIEWKRTTKADGDAFGGVSGDRMKAWIATAAEADAALAKEQST